MYKFIKILFTVIFKIFNRIEYLNTENIPEGGGYILCPNHVSLFDPLIIAVAENIPQCSFLAKEELFKNPLIRFLAKSIDIVPIKRGEGDLGAMRKTIALVNDKKTLIIFPEGTRSKTGSLGEGKDGVAFIAKRTNCMVIPCSINKKPRIFRKLKVMFGKPLYLKEYIEGKDLSPATQKLMSEISAGLDKLNE